LNPFLLSVVFLSGSVGGGEEDFGSLLGIVVHVVRFISLGEEVRNRQVLFVAVVLSKTCKPL